MRKSPLLMLLGAAFLGVIAVIIARFALAAPQQTASAPAVDMTPAVVAIVPMSFGDRVTADKLKLVDLPAGAIPAGAFKDIPATVADGNRIAQHGIVANEVIVLGAISGSGNRLSTMGVIGPAMRAFSISVTEPSAVSGLIAPGDRVDVYVTRTPPEHAPRPVAQIQPAATPGVVSGPGAVGTGRGPAAPFPQMMAAPSAATADKPQPFTDLLIQDARVLAIGQNVNVNSEKPETVRSATLEVTPAQVAKLTLGQSVGSLALALRAQADKDHSAIAPLRVEDLHDGPPRVVMVQRTRVRSVKTVRQAAPSIEIVRAGASTHYAVPQ